MKMRKTTLLLKAAGLAAIVAATLSAQVGGPTSIFSTYDPSKLQSGEYTLSFVSEVRSAELDSKLMGRKMPYRILLPPGYSEAKNSSVRYGTIYLLHGLTGHFSNWTDKTKLAEYAANHNFVIVTPEGDNGWYSDSVSVANDKYESYIVNELIPAIDKTFRTAGTRETRFIAGLSMGGYGAIKFGLKYPEMFSLVGSFSGALGAASFTEKNAGAIGKSMIAIFGPEDSDTRKANDIFKLVRDLTPDKVKTMPFIYQSCGTEDFLFANNREFLGVLVEKRVPHEYREHPGGHDWPFWDAQVKEFLEVAAARPGK